MGRTNLRDNLKVDFERLTRSYIVKNLSQHVSSYEKRVRGLVREFDLKSRDARVKGKKRLDKFSGQIKRTRGDLEKKLNVLFTHEASRLNQGYVDLLDYLRSLATDENQKTKTRKKTSKKSTRSTGAKKKTQSRKATLKVKSKAANEAASSPVATKSTKQSGEGIPQA